MEMTRDPQASSTIQAEGQPPASPSFLPGIGALIGVSLTFVLVGIGRGFWDTLHAAWAGYTERVVILSGGAAIIGALVGLLACRALRKRLPTMEKPRPRWPRLVLGAWLSLAPALHWLASLFIFLYVSRYIPSGGKIVAVLGGLFHVLLLGLAILAAVSLIRRSRLAHPIFLSYLVIVAAGLVLGVLNLSEAAGILHVLPFISWLFSGFPPVAVIVVVSLALYLGLGVSTLLVRKQNGSRYDLTASKGHPPGGATFTHGFVAESTGFFLAALCLLAYFLTSQFDVRPTSAGTHSLLLALTASFTVAAMFIEKRRAVARMLLRAVAPGLLLIEVAILVALHRRDETEPIILMAMVMGIVVVLALFAALAAPLPVRDPT